MEVIEKRKKIYQAINLGNVTEFKELLNEYPELISDPGVGLNGWICQAAEEGSIEMVSHLIKLGVDINGTNTQPIYYAISNGHYDLTKWFIENGADIHWGGGKAGGTALVAASCEGYVNIASLLVENGIDIHKRINEDRLNALSYAVMYQHDEMAAYLSSLGLELPPEPTLFKRIIFNIEFHIRKFFGV